MKKIVGLQTFIWENNFKSLALLILFPILLIIIWYLIVGALIIVGGDSSSINEILNAATATTPLIIFATAIWFVIAWIFNKQLITKMTGAKKLDRKDNSEIYNIVENLAISRGLRTPDIYIIEDSSMNAFASGLNPNDAFIAFSTGLLENLDKQEIEAVAAHELTHIINRDTRLMLIAIVFVGIIQTLANMFLRMRFSRSSDDRDNNGNSGLIIFLVQIVVFVISFIITVIVQMAISRKREFLADAGSVELTKNAQALISALQKISQDPLIEAVHNPSVGQMFIENPQIHRKRKVSIIEKLFSTHPPISERIEALKAIG